MISGSEQVVIRLLAYAFVITIMFAVGTRVTVREIAVVFRDRNLMLRALAANVLLVPALGWAICRMIPLAADVSTGVLFLSALPGAPFAVQFTSRGGNSSAFAAVLSFVLSLAAVSIVTPVAVAYAPPGEARMTVVRISALLIFVQMLPLLAGIAVTERCAAAGHRLGRYCGVAATVLFTGSVLVTLGVKSAAIRSIGAGGLSALALLIAGALLTGWLLGGPRAGDRKTLAMQTGFRNVALSLAVAVHLCPGTGVDAVVISYSALVIPSLFLFSMIVRSR